MSCVARLGSPPQVRGKPCAEAGSGKSGRITPAGAGKTPIEDNAFAEIRDHPRRCGENSSGIVFFCFEVGSPPQVRGKRICFSVRTQQTGITPAGAGKTLRRQERNTPRWDHPRRCGENALLFYGQTMGLGSPPQVRGKRAHCAGRKRSGRITPAGAGKTRRLPWRLGF